MLHLIPLFSLLVLLLPSFLASPIERAPIAKRYTGVKIQSFRNGLCLSPIGRSVGNGVPVGTIDCYQARTWDINPGSGSITVSGFEDYVLDAGSGNTNGEKLKTWQSYPGLFQQTWYLTDDRRIAITGGNQCLDQGNNDSGTQTWQCYPDNINQIWTLVDASNFNVQVPGQQPVLDPAIGITYQDGQEIGQRLHPYQRPDLCVTVDGGAATEGALVDIAYCQPNDNTYNQLQLFDLPTGPGQEVHLHAYPEFCLNAGYRALNGSKLRLGPCGTLATSKWTLVDGTLTLSDTGLCLDVQAESGVTPSSPYDILRNLQVWQCYPGNNNQQFFTINRLA
ncbi:hypothetical protein I316_04481 [Kwoniella heveanensis BCC8398]|uniref:Ricin B lectin domain-containing protein n=1 Tax=Kwoniella heveanensis BCC8398 TaxID=1296120 RepID=A0A1B9GRR4_9TREE|nr:hypothetical protein I316_04481 [Kwoniella heveanensis BCC8398]